VGIVDAGDDELPRGQIGEIVMRGDNVMQGYWNKPAETAEALRNDYMHTGDLGYMNDQGLRLRRRPAQGHDHHRHAGKILKRELRPQHRA
jgi:acyl-CoA synthetase (AMP-forming)/AMP-acid ligase II